MSCGNGTRKRELECIQEITSNLIITVEKHHCPIKPTAVYLSEPCFMPDCSIYTTQKTSITTAQYITSPVWKTEEWSPVIHFYLVA